MKTPAEYQREHRQRVAADRLEIREAIAQLSAKARLMEDALRAIAELAASKNGPVAVEILKLAQDGLA